MMPTLQARYKLCKILVLVSDSLLGKIFFDRQCKVIASVT